MVEQAGDEVRRRRRRRQAVGLDQRERLPGIPHVAQVDGMTVEHRDEQRAQHADEVSDRRGGELASAVGRVLPAVGGFRTRALMAVHDALGLAGGAGGEGDQRPRRRIGRAARPPSARRRAGRRSSRRIADDDRDDGDVGAQVGLENHAPEALCRDEYLRPGVGEDVAQFFAAVEVHDRHHHRTEERRRPERRRGFHPVRQLECDHVAGTDAARPQTRRPAGGP